LGQIGPRSAPTAVSHHCLRIPTTASILASFVRIRTVTLLARSYGKLISAISQVTPNVGLVHHRNVGPDEEWFQAQGFSIAKQAKRTDILSSQQRRLTHLPLARR
jgi:hypothetical protein